MKFKTVMQTFNPGKSCAKRVPVRVGFCPHCKDWITAVGDSIATHSPCKGPCGVQIRMGLMESAWTPDKSRGSRCGGADLKPKFSLINTPPTMNNSPEGAQGSANSGTPLTDAVTMNRHCSLIGANDDIVFADHARTLERQLAQSEERVAKLEAGLKYIAALHASRDTLLQEMTHDKASTLLSTSKTN